MIDTQLALEAQANITWIADHWDDLKARLGGSAGGGLQIRVQTSELPPLPIDLHVSDLMAEIDWQVARHYSNALLMDEPDWRPPSWTTQGMLRGIAERYGHFVTNEGWGQAFCDDAYDYRSRVEKTLERPAPPEYLGPCPIAECEGELYARGSTSKVRCPACLTETTREEQGLWVGEQVKGRKFAYSEIPRALKVLSLDVSVRTWERWTSAGTPDQPKAPKIAKDQDGLYRIAQAIGLALQSPRHADKREFFAPLIQEAT